MLKGQAEESKNILESMKSDLWSNATCCGYAILACQKLNYSQKEIQTFIQALELTFGNYSVEAAKKRYYRV